VTDDEMRAIEEAWTFDERYWQQWLEMWGLPPEALVDGHINVPYLLERGWSLSVEQIGPPDTPEERKVAEARAARMGKYLPIEP
jgi:hypothetical protein